MAAGRMVHLRTVSGAFPARVLAARLGADGIVTELRGPVDGPYPIGNVAVFVDEDDIGTARELLLADEVEAAFDDVDVDGEGALAWVHRRPAWITWVTVAVLVAAWATVSLRMV